jgi:hypothetical protein
MIPLLFSSTDTAQVSTESKRKQDILVLYRSESLTLKKKGATAFKRQTMKRKEFLIKLGFGSLIVPVLMACSSEHPA